MHAFEIRLLVQADAVLRDPAARVVHGTYLLN
jgi:hypothetical protein